MPFYQYIENKGNPFLGAFPVVRLIHPSDEKKTVHEIKCEEVGLGWYKWEAKDFSVQGMVGYLDCGPKLDAMLGDRFKPLDFTK